MLAGTALAVVVAASGIAVAVTRDTGSRPNAGQLPALGGGTAATPGGGTPTSPLAGTGAGAVPGAGAAVRSYEGTLSWTWGTGETKRSVVNLYCTAGACVTALSNRVPTLAAIALGSGASGTYPFALPRRGDPCTTNLPVDAIKGSVVLTETTLSFRSTSPGWDLRCGNGKYTRNAKRTMSYSGLLQP